MTQHSLKVAQLNLRHSKLPSDNLSVLLSEEDIDICMLQEPYVSDNRVKCLNSASHKLFYCTTNNIPRSCILVGNHIDAFLNPDLSSPDVTVVSAKDAKGHEMILASVYMAHNKEAPPEEVKRVLAAAKTRRASLVLCCDANARHTIWGSSEINARGESLFDFIMSTNLLICNRGNKPTFNFPSSERCRGWEEVLDITLMSENSPFNIENWRVSDECSFSDHRLILFNISTTVTNPKVFRNPRNANWDKFARIVGSELRTHRLGDIMTNSELDNAARLLERTMVGAYKKSCPVSRKKKARPPWWSGELDELRRSARSTFNQCYISKDWQPYKDALREYKRAIKKAKRTTWGSYCGSIETLKESCRLTKILSKDHTNPSLVRRLDGSWTESPEQSLTSLLDTHFPDSGTGTSGESSAEGLEDEATADTLIKIDSIVWAVNSFSPYKSPGPDGILPIMLQKVIGLVSPRLRVLYTASLRLNHIPESWRKVKVIFIPKSGKIGHESVKDFRPISLSSFILKTLERILDEHIRSLVTTSGLSNSQHAYMKGKSTETALHEVVSTAERGLFYKQYTMAAFLDIEGAFNNVKTESILQALVDLNVNSRIVRWIDTMLRTRQINAQWGEVSATRSVCRGTPQGGVLSPLLWLVVINTLLVNMDNKRVRVVAYADDVAVMVTGPCVSVISDIMGNILGEISTWATGCGLSVNPDKTDLLLFTNRRVIPQYTLPSLNGKQLELSDSAKYLGVILDPKLSWKLNIEHRVKKAQGAFYACKKTFGRTWGLNPKMVLWMYTAVVRPVLTYGVSVWWPAIERDRRLSTVQRTACVGVTGALRTCPSAALSTMLNLLPIEQFAKNEAAKSALRLREMKCWTQRDYGHSKILGTLPSGIIPGTTDYASPRLNFGRNFRTIIPHRVEWRNHSPLRDVDIDFFTDGSKTDSGVGAGVFSSSLSITLSIGLPCFGSIFQAEVMAIVQACRLLQRHAIEGRNVKIFSDSQAAIRALSSVENRSILVRECRNLLDEIGARTRLSLVWVPSHAGIVGNETADELAKRGSCGNADEQSVLESPLRMVYSAIDRHFCQEADRNWRELTTCRISRGIWPRYDGKRTEFLLTLNRNAIARLTAVITGHWAIGTHAARMGIQYRRYCRSCDDELMPETPEHYLLHCPALANIRRTTLGRPFFVEIPELGGIKLSLLLKYIDSTNWM